MKKQNGITLIALVITIIVLLILAGVTISLVIGDNGILTQATHAVKENKEAGAREDIAMAWASVESDYWADWTKDTSVVKSDYFKKDVLQEYLDGKGQIISEEINYNEGGISTFEYASDENQEIEYDVTIEKTGKVELEEKDKETNEEETETTPTIDPSLIHNGIIPEGGTYYVGATSTEPGKYTGATATYRVGDSFPETVNVGDVYVYGDYEYRYNQHIIKAGYSYEGLLGPSTAYEFVWASSEQSGWGVMILSPLKTTQGKMLGIINDIPVTNLNYTFASLGPEAGFVWDESYLISLSEDFVIPNSVTNVEGMFYYCDNLISLPESFIIPNNVTNMEDAFYGCDALTGTIEIPCSCENQSIGYDDIAIRHFEGCGH